MSSRKFDKDSWFLICSSFAFSWSFSGNSKTEINLIFCLYSYLFCQVSCSNFSLNRLYMQMCVFVCAFVCVRVCLCVYVGLCVCVYKLCFYITTCLIRLNYCEQLLYDVLLWNVWGQSKLNSSLVYPRKQNKKRLFIIHRVLKSFVLFFLHIIFADYTERTFAYSCWLWENI